MKERLMIQTAQCPECSGRDVSRSRRKGWMERNFWAFFGHFPWRCSFCKERFFVRDRGEQTLMALGRKSRAPQQE